MTEYKKILKRAKQTKHNVETNYTVGIPIQWSYLFAKSIQNPKHDVEGKKDIGKPPKPFGTYISRQIPQKDYQQIAKDLISFVDRHGRMPNYVKWGNYKIRARLYHYMFARIVVYTHEHGKLPLQVQVNSKAFTKPTEPANEVYTYTTKKYGIKFTTLDDILEYVANNFTYQYYYDDSKSNKEVTDTKSGNCTDLLQWLCNMVEPLDYEWQCIHVQCRQSGAGHVFGKFRHKQNTGNEWVLRDIAAVADNGDIHSIWCSDGDILAVNPSWWLENLHR